MRDAIVKFVLEWRFAPAAIALAIMFAITSLLLATHAGDFSNAPDYFSSERAYLGMLLLTVLIPSYIGMTYILSARRTRELAATLDARFQLSLTEEVIRLPLAGTLIAATAGLLYAIFFNIPDSGPGFLDADASPAERFVIFGQALIWIMVALLLYQRMYVSQAFRKASDSVPVDLFEVTPLRPFAQIGLIDVLIVAGGLVLSTVQSLDFSFRPDNYTKALAVTLPAVVYLMINPMWLLHRKLQEIKQAELTDLNSRIAKAPKSLEVQAINQLEVLLQRRERTRALTTWPMDLSVLQRFMFYIIIPPLAWIGAAIVEQLVTGLIE